MKKLHIKGRNVLKRIVAVFWHGQYNMVLKSKENLDEDMNISLYSSRLLMEKMQDVKILYKEMKTADLIVLGMVSTESIWGEIKQKAKKCKGKLVFVGEEHTFYCPITNEDTFDHKIRLYYTYGGCENLCEMLRYIVHNLLNESVTYEPPKEIPWEGIYHPESAEIFKTCKEYFEKYPKKYKYTVGLITSRYAWINDNLDVERQLTSMLISHGYNVLPIFVSTIMDWSLGAMGMSDGVKKLFFDGDGQSQVDGVIKLTSFLLEKADGENVFSKLDCPIFKPILSAYYSEKEWINGSGVVEDVSWSIAIPEMEGCTLPMMISGVKREFGIERHQPITERCERFILRVDAWIKLRFQQNRNKKVVLMLNGNAANPEGNIGNAKGLDALEAVCQILKGLKKSGYVIENIPENGDELSERILKNHVLERAYWKLQKNTKGVLGKATHQELEKWIKELPADIRDLIGVSNNDKSIAGLEFGNAALCIEPENSSLLSEYLVHYRFLERKYNVDAIIYVGAGGNLENLPGKTVGLSNCCFTDVCIGNLPIVYLINSRCICESIIAKRRAMAVIVSHIDKTLDQEELQVLMHALEGGFIHPGEPGGEIGGKNLHGVICDALPTKKAWDKGSKMADRILEKFFKKEERYPICYAADFLGEDLVRTGGEQLSVFLRLLGVEPVWRKNGKLRELKVVSEADLGRPRVGIIVTVSLGVSSQFETCINLLRDAVSRVDSIMGQSFSDSIFQHNLYDCNYKEKENVISSFFDGFDKEAKKQLREKLKQTDVVGCNVTDNEDRFNISQCLSMAAEAAQEKDIIIDWFSESIQDMANKFLEKKHSIKSYYDVGVMAKELEMIFRWRLVAKSVSTEVFGKWSELIFEHEKEAINHNPFALCQIVERLVEANKRNFWNADKNTIDKLYALYLESEGRIEEFMSEK